MKRNKVIVLLFCLLATVAMTLLISGCGKSDTSSDAAGQQAARQQYHCPMHPTIVSDEPGDCPICGMRLAPIRDDAKADASTPSAVTRKKTMYRSTMNPGEISDHPGKDSMGMELVPFEMEESADSTPEGLAPVSITSTARARMGMTLGVVEKRSLLRPLRTSAVIIADETRMFRVTTKIDGWVDQLRVNVTGQEVKKGDPLLTIYSPELVRAQQEYVTAMASAGSTTQSADGASLNVAETWLEAMRRRFELWDIGDDQIEQLEKTGRVQKDLTLNAPASGYVIEKNVLAGQKIMPGDSLLVIADLTHVWGDANIYQSDLPYVKVGMPVKISLPFWEGKVFEGRVTFVSPTLDPETRSAKARLEIDNSALLLKPGMYADAQLDFALGESLAIPDSAVMRTGQRAYAFKDAGDGRLLPVVIQVGPRAEGYFQLLAGLQEGDRVVTSANFLVDSESSLKAAVEAAARAASAGAAPAPGGDQH